MSDLSPILDALGYPPGYDLEDALASVRRRLAALEALARLVDGEASAARAEASAPVPAPAANGHAPRRQMARMDGSKPNHTSGRPGSRMPVSQILGYEIDGEEAAPKEDGPGRLRPGPSPKPETLRDRRRMAEHLHEHGPTHANKLADALDIAKSRIHNLLHHEWFEWEPDGYHLSAAGQAVLNEGRPDE